MSSRRPRSSGPGRSVMAILAEKLECEQRDAEGNRGVGEVERRPAIVAEINFNEIDHIAIADSVVQIANSPSKDQAQRHMKEFLVYWRPPAISKDSGDSAY